MRYCYIDSSALAKAYMLESGTERVQNLLRSARTDPPTVRALVSALSALEITSAIMRKLAAREIHRTEAEYSIARVQSDFSADPPPSATPYQLIFPGPEVLQHGQELITVHGLRTYDALHLATALAARASLPADCQFIFMGCDGGLCSAAAAEGIETDDPTD